MQMALGFADDDPPMRLAVLGSGSSGNALVVECGQDRLLVDAGFSGRELERRLELVGLEAESLDALVLTHEHGDHTRGAGVIARRHGLTVHATGGTLEGVTWGKRPPPTRRIRSGEPAEVAGFEVEPFLLPHDAREPVGLVVEDRCGRRLGLVADLGTRSRLAWGRLRDLDILVLETNHDLEMLRSGPYPWPLKQRVAGRHGHLSNRDAADGVAELVGDRLRCCVLYHLSRTNNTPALAAAVVGEELARAGAEVDLVVAEQDRPSPWLAVGAADAAPPRPEELRVG